MLYVAGKCYLISCLVKWNLKLSANFKLSSRFNNNRYYVCTSTNYNYLIYQSSQINRFWRPFMNPNKYFGDTEYVTNAFKNSDLVLSALLKLFWKHHLEVLPFLMASSLDSLLRTQSRVTFLIDCQSSVKHTFSEGSSI